MTQLTKDPVIGKKLQELLQLTKSREDRDMVRQAFEVAEKFHQGQTRKSGEPYILHPLHVAIILAELDMDVYTIAAGLLHDTLEDTALRFDELQRLFPDPVAQLVQGVTKINRMHFDTSREAQIENIRKIMVAMARDIRVLVIKLCDRLHNMRTLKHMREEKRKEIAQETLDIYAPLANRMGIVKLKAELEDLSLYWIAPEKYLEIAQSIDQKKAERQELINQSVMFLRNQLDMRGYSHVQISGRPKHFYSIYQKMVKSGSTFDEIFDLNALRIFCDTKSECYEIMGIVHEIWSPQPNRFKDYIALPKANQYQSIHTTVIGYRGMVTEIQIRTHSMHEIAEYGIAAHWRYKEGKQANSEEVDQRFMRWLRELSTWIQDPSDANSLFDTLKEDVFADVVLCFTPTGDVIELPAGATPIDFAFAIHTKVGERCVGARVNKRMVALRTELKHGDIVEIETSNSGHPSRDWLDVVKTGRARSKIKHWLKSKEIHTWAQMGREALNRVLKERNISVAKSELDAHLEIVKTSFNLETLEEVLAEIGFKSISAQAALRRMNPEWAKKKREQKSNAVKAKPKKAEIPISIEGVTGLQIRIANCCNPIPGDPIVGFVTRGRGVTVHHGMCKSLKRLHETETNDDRFHSAEWLVVQGHLRNVVIRVEAQDRTGLLLELSSALNELNIFITGVNTRSNLKTGTATIDFNLNIYDQGQMEKVVQTLHQLKGVIRVERITRGI